MNALTIFTPGNGVPVARRALCDLNEKIARRSADLERLRAGRRKLAEELEVVQGAQNELAALVDADAHSLIERIKSGIDHALHGVGGRRAQDLAASLAASSIQNQVGEKASAELDSQIAALESEIETIRAQKPAAIRSVLIEVAEGYRADLASVADELRQLLVVLGSLDRIVVKPTGEFIPDRDRRIVVTLPAIAGVPETIVAAPASTIDRAQRIWRDFASELDSDPLATVETLVFPHVSGTEDSTTTVYADYSSAERHQIDLERASGVK
jgi:hypothetical protein